MKIKIIFVVIFLAGLAIGGFVTWKWVSKVKDKEFAKTEKVYQEQNKETVLRYQEMRADYKELANKARYLIEQKLYIKKVKNGQVIYDPASTMEISKIIENKTDSVLKN